MKFFVAKNLTEQAVEPCDPSQFVTTEIITPQIRAVKSDRQDFYKNPKTQHCFYAIMEGTNPNQRIGKNNPPRLIYGFIADYDAVISDQRIQEAIAGWKFKPAVIETSLGGHRRLIWFFETPMICDSYEFATFLHQKAVKWLDLHTLPGLDEPAFTAPSRLYCRGDAWQSLDNKIPSSKSQAFFVEVGREFRFKSSDAAVIALDIIEKECIKQFPGLNWPSDFSEGSQGPSFWLPASQSPMSAIVKPDGMFTFSGSATKPFYTWADILGKEFVANFATETMGKATADIWYDGHKYHRKNGNGYISMERSEFTIWLEVTCKLSGKPDSSGNSGIKKALDHIHEHQRIIGAAPFVPRAPGLLLFNGQRKLNIYCGKPIQPAPGQQKFGSQGNSPFLSRFTDTWLSTDVQYQYMIAWLQYYYEGVFNNISRPGQAICLMGESSTGKTFGSRQFIGVNMGGFVDVASVIVEGSQFNSHALDFPHWCMDDDTPNSSNSTANQTHLMVKKVISNQEFEYHKKFEVPTTSEWGGRLFMTANLDHHSARLLGPLDDGNMRKINLFRCTDRAKRDFTFPNSREETMKILIREAPFFFAALLQHKVNEDVVPRCPDKRYGWGHYHEPSLLDITHQTSPSSPFKEVILDTLKDWFSSDPSPFWEGTVSQLSRLLLSDPRNEQILRTINLSQANKYLENIQRENVVKCEATIDPVTKSRIWKFYRPNP